MSRIYYDGQKTLDNVRLSDGTSDNGEFMTKQDLLAELTRLRGEVERLTARAETAKAQLAELRARVRPGTGDTPIIYKAMGGEG